MEDGTLGSEDRSGPWNQYIVKSAWLLTPIPD